MTRAALAFTCATLLFAQGSHAQQTIASDRPGIGSGSSVLLAGTVQLETGVDYAQARSNDTYSFGQALVRIGAPGVEVELFLNSFVIARTDLADGPGEGEGFQDLGLGLKAPLLADAAGRFSLSVQGILTIPTGSDVSTANEWIPAGNLLADLGVSDRVAVSVNAGYQAGPGELEGVATVFVTPGVALGSGWGAYGGWAGFFGGGGDTHIAEGGFTYLANGDLQLDLNGGWDVDTNDFFVGAGVAVRWTGR